MSNALKFTAACGAPPIYVDDVFQSYVRTGTGAEATITTNIDLSVSGGIVWSKGRSGATDHAIYDTARGATYDLVSNSTAAQTTQAQGLKSVSTTGHTWGTLAKVNTNTATYVDWVMRNAPKFFTHTTKSHTNGTPSTVDLSILGTVGMVAVKRTDSTSNWFVFHRSQTAGKLTYLNLTDAETTDATISVSGTTLTIASATATGTYVVYAWAHDSASDGVIQCGGFTADGSGNATVTLGWEPQYLLTKKQTVANNWSLLDTSRSFINNAGGATASNMLFANTSGTEGTQAEPVEPTAQGFNTLGYGASTTYIYLAIRRPNKPPTAGTQVYNAIAHTGTGAEVKKTGVGFTPDLLMNLRRSTGGNTLFNDRLRGSTAQLYAGTTPAAENIYTLNVVSHDMDGVTLSTSANVNQSSETYSEQFFRRAPKFFDEVCDTGTGSAHTVSHNLVAIPELMLRKGRSDATQWEVYSADIANTEKLILNTTAAKATDTTAWNSTTPTASVFTVGTGANVNTTSATYVTYLFATLAGISKIGSYTGNGSTQTINCGFTAGARFIMIKRTDSTGDWYVWDSVRGIVAGNDPHRSINGAVAEVTTDDSVDPDNSGFIVNQNGATFINQTSATYIFLAIA